MDQKGKEAADAETEGAENADGREQCREEGEGCEQRVGTILVSIQDDVVETQEGDGDEEWVASTLEGGVDLIAVTLHRSWLTQTTLPMNTGVTRFFMHLLSHTHASGTHLRTHLTLTSNYEQHLCSTVHGIQRHTAHGVDIHHGISILLHSLLPRLSLKPHYTTL